MRNLRTLVAATALVLGSALPALAVQLDAPTITIGDAGHTSLVLHVQAGASGAPAGFTVEWMTKADFDTYGGFPSDAYWPLVGGCDFFGVPTLHEVPGGSFQLGAGESADVTMGNVFDETGLSANYLDELNEGTQYVFRTRALATPNADESSNSATQLGATSVRQANDCTFTQGYWKNHTGPGVWPVSNLTLGNINYTAAQLLAIFNTSASGNGLISLAHQLIAAKLNIAKGASAPASVLAAIASADALIGNLVVPPTGGSTDSLSPASTSSLTDTLDDYNQGKSGPGHCDETPARHDTWGRIKSLYR